MPAEHSGCTANKPCDILTLRGQDMSSSRWSSPLLRFAFLGAAVLLAVGTASAQFASTPDSSHSAAAPATESSSNDFVVTDSGSGDGSEPSAPEPAGHAAGQYDNAPGGGSHGLRSRLAFEAGGGFNAPIGNDGPYITWGGNFTGGAGLRFSRRLSALVGYQFIDNKLPGAFRSEERRVG